MDSVIIEITGIEKYEVESSETCPANDIYGNECTFKVSRGNPTFDQIFEALGKRSEEIFNLVYTESSKQGQFMDSGFSVQESELISF